jgi:hypothetical protein
MDYQDDHIGNRVPLIRGGQHFQDIHNGHRGAAQLANAGVNAGVNTDDLPRNKMTSHVVN